MKADRRLSALETALSPTQLVLCWLDEAHAFGDLESYVRSLLDEGADDSPLDRLARRAANGARAGSRGKRPEVVQPAVRSALRETVFRFELVMRINVTAHDLLEREALIDAALAAQVALVASEDPKKRRSDPTVLARLALVRDLVAGRLIALRAAAEARSIVEGRYLDGHAALFPDADQAWATQLGRTERLAKVAAGLAELDGVRPADPADPDAVASLVTDLVADLVEPAKATALEKLGEGAAGFGIATGWLRARLERAESPPEEDAAAGPRTPTR